MYFLDDPEVMEKIRKFWQENEHLEKEHLEVRDTLHKAEIALRAEPGNEELKNRIEQLKGRLQEIEKQAPWITAVYPLEFALWSDPHG